MPSIDLDQEPHRGRQEVSDEAPKQRQARGQSAPRAANLVVTVSTSRIVVTWARGRRAAGTRWEEIKRELERQFDTVRRWCLDGAETKALVPLRVVAGANARPGRCFAEPRAASGHF